MNIKVKFSFNEELYRFQTKLQYAISIDKTKHKNKEYLIFTFGSLALGFFFLYFLFDGAGMIIGPLLVITGCGYGLYYIVYRSSIKKAKIIYEKVIEDEVTRLKEMDELIEMEFTDEHLYYNDIDFGHKFPWKKIKSFLFVDNIIFLVLNNDNFSCFAIHETLIGSENFMELTKYVESNLQLYPHDHRYKSTSKSNPDLIDSPIINRN